MPSRIAHDLNNGGFDPKVHLSIAEESLHHLQHSIHGLPEIEEEYEQALRAFKDAPAGPVKERVKKLVDDMKELKEELEGAPAKIEELESDIAMLRKYITNDKDEGDNKDSKTQEGKIGGLNGADKENNDPKKAPVEGGKLSKNMEGLVI